MKETKLNMNEIKHEFNIVRKCTRCNKTFKHGSTFINHITNPRVCNGNQDNVTYFQNNFPKVINAYHTILCINDDTVITDIEKKRQRNYCMLKCMKCLAAIRDCNYDPISSGISESIIRKMIRIYLNLKSNKYDDENWKDIDIKKSFVDMFI